jgi:hypothetical protein
MFAYFVSIYWFIQVDFCPGLPKVCIEGVFKIWEVPPEAIA